MVEKAKELFFLYKGVTETTLKVIFLICVLIVFIRAIKEFNKHHKATFYVSSHVFFAFLILISSLNGLHDIALSFLAIYGVASKVNWFRYIPGIKSIWKDSKDLKSLRDENPRFVLMSYGIEDGKRMPFLKILANALGLYPDKEYKAYKKKVERLSNKIFNRILFRVCIVSVFMWLFVMFIDKPFNLDLIVFLLIVSPFIVMKIYIIMAIFLIIASPFVNSLFDNQIINKNKQGLIDQH